MPAGFADAVRSWTAAGGRLVFVAGGDPDGIAGFDGALLRRADDEVPASSGWHDAGAGDWRKMGVIFGGREYPQMRNANVDGYCKARCLFAVDPSAAGVEPFAEFRCGSERFAVAARRGNAVWLPQYLLMPFLFTGETTADWAAQRLDAFGKRVLAEAMERIAR